MPKSKYLIIVAILISLLPFVYILTIPSDYSQLQLAGSFWAYVGAVLLWWQIILGTRQLCRWANLDMIEALNIHKWLGKYGTILILIHPIIQIYRYTYTLSEAINWTFVPQFGSQWQLFLNHGRLALVWLLIIYISSVILRSRLRYQPWLYIHYLAYVMVINVFVHGYMGTMLNQIGWLKVLWSVAFLLYVGLVIYKLLVGSGTLATKYQITNTTLNQTLLQLVLSPVNKPLRKPLGGQYLHLQLRAFGQGHPFSVLSYNESNGDIQLSIRVIGDFTDRLSKLAIGAKVHLDGYYGHYTQNLDTSTPTLIIAGGVGLAPFWSMINQHTANLRLIYCTSTVTDSLNLEPLKQLLGNRLSHHIGTTNRLKPTDIELVLNSITGGDQSQIQVYICAGHSLTKMAKTELLRLGVTKANIHIEDFGY